MDIELTNDDRAALAELDGKLSIVRDAVRGTAEHFSTGFLLHGEAGIGKSHTVLNELQRLSATFVVHNSRMTGRGLVDRLQQSPSSIHLIEDAESMFDDQRAWGVLRSALWSQSKLRLAALDTRL